jgi:hypothetical protein
MKGKNREKALEFFEGDSKGTAHGGLHGDVVKACTVQNEWNEISEDK